METSKPRPTTAPREAVQLVVIAALGLVIFWIASYLGHACGLLHS